RANDILPRHSGQKPAGRGRAARVDCPATVAAPGGTTAWLLQTAPGFAAAPPIEERGRWRWNRPVQPPAEDAARPGRGRFRPSRDLDDRPSGPHEDRDARLRRNRRAIRVETREPPAPCRAAPR